MYVYDEKTQGEKGFYNQRRRWLATQFAQWGRVFRDLPRAILSGNIDYSDKLIQWMLPPRLILFGGIIVMGCIMQIIDWPLALKWWALFLIMGVTLCLAIPNKLVDDQFKKSINKLPIVICHDGSQFIPDEGNEQEVREHEKKRILNVIKIPP